MVPDRENKGNLPKIFKNLFLHKEFNLQHKDIVEVLSIVVECFHDHLTCIVGELGNGIRLLLYFGGDY